MELNYFINKIISSDVKDILPQIPANSFDLIITSPPYADKRNSVYNTVPADSYVEWFLPNLFSTVE